MRDEGSKLCFFGMESVTVVQECDTKALGQGGCSVKLGWVKLGWVSGAGANATNLGGWPYEPIIRARKAAVGCLLFPGSDLFCFSPSYMFLGAGFGGK